MNKALAYLVPTGIMTNPWRTEVSKHHIGPSRLALRITRKSRFLVDPIKAGYRWYHSEDPAAVYGFTEKIEEEIRERTWKTMFRFGEDSGIRLKIPGQGHTWFVGAASITPVLTLEK